MKTFFDTETTGKALMKAGPKHPDQPRIVQFAALLTDDEGNEESMFSCIIRPDGWTVPAEAAAIHGITTEKALACGVPIICALSMFSMFCAVSDTLVAHNIDFDDLVAASEYHRAGKPARHSAMPKFCTMKNSTKLCNLPGPYGPKWPKLEEALRILLKKELVGAHDALADVRGTVLSPQPEILICTPKSQPTHRYPAT